VQNLLHRLAPALAPFSLSRVPGIAKEEKLLDHVELKRERGDARALLVLRDDDDGCPKLDAPPLAQALRARGLPFPVAVVLAYREYESLFLPCIEQMAGRSFDGPGGARPGLRADARFEGDFEALRGVKEWLTHHMAQRKRYKPAVDQLPLTRMVDFDVVRQKGLPWFGSLDAR
ncbi:MAG: hypothetical protein IPJ34_28355, partial [Myxococcales bacterium]|nr:hypothetical protein [Myxococcales bacterium]